MIPSFIRNWISPPLDLGPYMITDGMRVRIRRARRKLSLRAYADSETRRIKAARLRFEGGRAA